MMKQRTLQREVRANGIGLHSGQPVQIGFLPHVIDGGIVFRRTDLNPAVDIAVDALGIQEAFMCSNLVRGQHKVGTIEHIMSALAGLGIDNLIIEVSAAEIPIMDGSAMPFVTLLLQGGLIEQNAAKKFIKIRQAISTQLDDKHAAFLPHDGFQLNFTIEFNHPAFSQEQQFVSIEFGSESFIEQVSTARTFGFMKDLDYLKANQLALGASLENAIGLDEQGVVNPEGLRFDNEFVRHKILDAVGDLYLMGHQILGQFNGHKSGHALNNQLLRQMIQQPECYEIVTFYNEADCPIRYLPIQ